MKGSKLECQITNSVNSHTFFVTMGICNSREKQTDMQTNATKNNNNESNIEKLKEKILFLDVDGVLNVHTGYLSGICKDELVMLLADIIKQTNCKIVLSTSWRINNTQRNKLLQILKEIGNIPYETVIG